MRYNLPIMKYVKHSHIAKTLPPIAFTEVHRPLDRDMTNFFWKTENFSQNLWFPQQSCVRFQSSGMLHRVER